MNQMTPESIANSILEVLSKSSKFSLYIFWIEQQENRDELCSNLSKLLEGSGALPVVLRKRLFHDPNSWAVDAISLLDDNREAVEAMGELIGLGRSIALVVIARGGLAVAQSASPATAPSWFPKYGGCEIDTFTRDLAAWTACALNAPEAAIGDVCSLLYELDRELCNVSEELARKDRHHGQALWGSALKERCGLATKEEFLTKWRTGLDDVRDARSYRPSLRSGWSMVAAMWATFLDNSPAKLLGLSKQYCEFLGITECWLPGDQTASTAILPVLFRGANDKADERQALAARGLIVCVGLSCQLATAAAHADQYGKVNATALTAISRELRVCLAAAQAGAASLFRNCQRAAV